MRKTPKPDKPGHGDRLRRKLADRQNRAVDCNRLEHNIDTGTV